MTVRICRFSVERMSRSLKCCIRRTKEPDDKSLYELCLPKSRNTGVKMPSFISGKPHIFFERCQDTHGDVYSHQLVVLNLY